MLLSLYLRAHDISERPIHADEATGAYFLAQRLQGGDYRFNPNHFHGPTLTALSEPIARLRGESSWSELSVTTLRLSPLLAGMLTVLSPLFFYRTLGHWGALLSAALIGTSPLIVYYNRMFIHESWLALFAIVSLALWWCYLRRPSPAIASGLGIAMGMMFATKETFVISAFAWSAASLLYLLAAGDIRKGSRLRLYLRSVPWLIAAALLVSAFFYTNGFTHWRGMWDALRSYFVYEISSGHEKPPLTYLHWMLWPKQSLGGWWTEAGLALLAGAAIFANRVPSLQTHFVRFVSVAVLIQVLVYSFIGYKTPWLMLVPWAQVCLVAGLLIGPKFAASASKQAFLVIIVLVLVGFQTTQSLRATGRFAGDARNPYAYSPTTRDPGKIKDWLDALDSAQPDAHIDPIMIVGKEFWPLPWYLRKYSVTYSTAPTPTGLADAPIIFATPEHMQVVDALSTISHQKFLRSLRENVPVALYLRNDLWETWKDSE